MTGPVIDRRHLPGMAVACTCNPDRGETICGDSPIGPLLYRCKTCKKLVPWCFGAADEQPDDCYDCYAGGRS